METLLRGLEGDRTVRHDTTVCVGPNTFELHHPYADTTYSINRNIIRPSSFAETSMIFPIEGCIITDSLVVDIFPEGSYNEQTVYLCPQNNNQYEFSQPIHGFDTIIRHSGTYTFRFPQGNCYDIYVIKVIDVNNDRGTEVVNKCKGEIYRYVDNGIPRTARSDTAYIKSVPRIGGCDSLVNVSVRFFDTIYNVVNGSICQGGSYTWSRSGYDNSGNYRTYRSIHDSTGVYVDALKTNMGCSNKQVLNLVVNPVYNDTIYDTVCYGVAYNAYGFNIPLNRIENRLYTISKINPKYSQFGCDSTTHLRLTIKPTKQTNLGDIDLCRGSSYDFHGRHLTTGGTYRDTLQTYLGCDSVVRVNIVMRENEYHPTNGRICDGNSYIWSISGYKRNALGNLVQTTIRDTLTQSGMYADTTLLTQYGCANKHNLTLVVNPIYNDTIYDTICYGSSYSGHGFNFTVPRRDTIYTITKVNNRLSVYGCDSITHLRLTVRPTKQTNLGDVDLCRGTSYDFHGRHLTAGGTYRDTLQTYLGCDSVVRVNIVMRENEYHPTNGRICDGNSYIWSISGYKRNALGNLVQTTIRDTLTQSGMYADTTLLTQYGCANKHNLTLVVNPVYNDTIYDTICYGSSYSGHGFNIPLVQIENRDYTIDRVNSLRSRFGCDSITTLKLQVWQKYNTHIYDTITENGHYDFFGRTLTTAGIYSSTLESVHGCDSTIMLHLFVHMNARTDFNADICQGQTYTENGFNADSTGTYYQRLQTIHGADSIVVLNLVVHPTYDDTVQAAICQGESYTLYGFNETTAGTYTHADTSRYGCDSLFTLVLTVNPVYDTTISAEIIEDNDYVFNGRRLTEQGVYYDTLQTVNGCDSTFILNLVVHQHVRTEFNAEICANERYTEHGFDTNITGTYYQRLQTIHGADSIVVLNLVVHPTYDDTVQAAICQGESYTLYGFNETTAGTYTHADTSRYGCDSLFTLVLTVNPVYDTTISAEIIEDNDYVFNGRRLTEQGVYYDTLQTVNGCDSTFILNLVVHQHVRTEFNAEICANERYTEHGFDTNITGTYYQRLQTIHGADSIVVLNLVVHPTYDDTIRAAICQGESYTLYGFNETTAGTYTHADTSRYGCDSLFTLVLTVNPVYDTTISAEIIEDNDYVFNGRRLTEQGVYYDTLQTVNGCDSTFILNLVVHQHVRTEFNAEICANERYTEHGFDTNITGTYYQRLQTIHGADSIVVLNLVVHPTYDDTIRAAICQGESYTLYGFNETTAGTYTHADTSRYGCDSLFTLVLTVNPVYDKTITAEICDGSIYNDYGFEESSAGLYTHSGQSIHGCDSLFRLNLIVNPVYDTLIVDSICIGATYDRNGFNEQTTGVYTQHLYSEHGCDSIVRLNLKVISFLDTIYADICEGQVYDLYGFNESRTGVYVDSLQSVWGCDSVVVLNLTVHENYSDTIYAETCDNIPYTLHGFNADSSGVYVRNLQSVYGCDSVVTLILTVWPTYTIPLNKEICEGETYIDHGFWLTYPGTFIISSHTSCHGCDSLFVLNLAVNPTYDELMVANICQGDTFRLQGYDNLVAWESGRYRDVIESSSGCDSAKTVILTVNPTYMDTIYGNICEGERYTEHGFNESSEGIYTNVLTSALGCDSILVLDLKLRQHYELTSTMEICQGEEYLFGDRILTETGIYKDTLHSEYGCDSIVELHLFVYPIYEDTIYRRICYGDTYSDENFNVSTQGTYQVSYRTANNCDSTITLILETVYYNDTIFETTCQGLDYDFYGTNLTQTGTYTHTLTSVEGCDSIITLNLIVNNPYKDSVYAVICEGETYTNYGFNETEQGRYERLFTTVGGCDSIKVLNLRVNNSYNDTIIARICSGEIYNDFGFSVDSPGFHTRQYHTIYGCDSIVTLNLSVTDKITDTIKAVICEGETYAENNFNASQTGEYVRELQTIYGCDSIIVLSLNVAPVYQDTIYKIIKDGEVYDKNGFFETEQGIYAQYLSTEYGCDSIVVLSLEVDRDAKVFIPNAFTPTDRFNRLFTIYSENETVVIDEVKILNRYGGIVFETTKPDEFWDGKYKGEYVQQGTYIYMVTYHSIHTPDKQHVLRGSVMVIY